MGNSASISNAATDDSNNFNVSGPQPRASGAARVIRTKFAAARDDFSNNNQTILDEFPELKDALEFIDTAIESMYESLPEDKENNTMNLSTIQKMHEIMNFYFEHEKEEHRRLIGDELTNCNAGPLLVDYLKIITSNGHAYPEPE